MERLQPDPICQGGLLGLGGSTVALSHVVLEGRRELTVRLSADGGRSWPVSMVLDPGAAAYSDLCRAPNGDVLCLYERGDDCAYEEIVLLRLVMDPTRSCEPSH